MTAMDSDQNSKSDADLLSGCLNGDSSCRQAFVRRFSNLVFATIQRTAKVKNAHLSQQDIEDLHQTAFLQLFESGCRKLRRYKGKRGCTLASWIRMLTSRIVLDHLRRGSDALAHRHQTVALEFLSDLNAPGPSPLSQLTAAEQRGQLAWGLKQLKARDQLVIRMHCLEGQPLPKIAQAIGISDKNIHSVKHRAIQRLKSVIKTYRQ